MKNIQKFVKVDLMALGFRAMVWRSNIWMGPIYFYLCEFLPLFQRMLLLGENGS